MPEAAEHPDQAAALIASAHDVLGQGLIARAASLSARASALAPEWPETASLACEVARAEGDLAGAAEAAQLWQSLAPEDAAAAFSAAILTGQALPPSPQERTPAPFVIADGFLSPLQQDLVAHHLLDHLGQMEAASVVQGGASQEDGTSRSAHVLYDPDAVAAWFSPLVAAYLPWALPCLGLAPFAVSQVELQLTASYHGDFYKAHHDITLGEEDSVAGRRVSFVYYFQLMPNAFAGGALRLYDQYGLAGTTTRERFTAVLPIPNRLVLFRSEALHEVMPVETHSNQAEAGRFTLNGWLHGSGSTPPPDDRL
ncbi:MAG: 2OG-Fe(II) oxygenase [Pseudomonadota bacterium]